MSFEHLEARRTYPFVMSVLEMQNKMHKA